jgi:hypothetical protein
MSMTKRYLESLPQEEQDAILGAHNPEDEDDSPVNIRAFVSGNMDEDDLTRRIVEDGILEL